VIIAESIIWIGLEIGSELGVVSTCSVLRCVAKNNMAEVEILGFVYQDHWVRVKVKTERKTKITWVVPLYVRR